jgi:hypothetical protein
VSYTVLSEGNLTFTLVPHEALAYGTVYGVALSGVQDPSGNTMPDTEWSFTTTNTIDNTAPTLISTIPGNLATYVDVNTDLSLTFSEALDQLFFDVDLTPNPGGIATWTNGGKTLNFDPAAPLLDDQQYTFTIEKMERTRILEIGVRDLAGNGFVGLKTVVFTTGAALEAGSIAGTIAGDPGTGANDPTGALVVAATGSILDGDDDFLVLGSAIVAGNNTYTLAHLPDDVYYPLAIMDTSGDGNLDPSYGDAIGVYGINFRLGDISLDSVTVAGGSHVTGVNFPLFDPSAISGTVQYSGTYAEGSYPLFVGLFDTSNFDPLDLPVAGTQVFWPDFPEWAFNTLDQLLIDDDYYVGAFLDVNFTGAYDPGVDPAGFYGGFPAPTAVHIEDGSDVTGIVITLLDPLASTLSAGVTWPVAKHNAAFQRLCEAVRESQTALKQ